MCMCLVPKKEVGLGTQIVILVRYWVVDGLWVLLLENKREKLKGMGKVSLFMVSSPSFIGRVKPGGMEAVGKFTHKGVSFKMNEVVTIAAGTAPGVRAKKTEAIRAWLKGEDNGQFICNPVIGGGRGPMPRFDNDTVYKLKVSLPLFLHNILQTLTLILSLTNSRHSV